MALYKGTLPVEFGATILTNDLIWWVPFGIILWRAFRQAQAPPTPREYLDMNAGIQQ
jgi:hypothetical protein